MSDQTAASAAGAVIGGATPYGWAGLAASFLGGSGLLSAPPMTPDNTLSGQVSFDFQKAFSPVYNKPLIDLENPVHIAVLAGLLVVGVVVWKKKFHK